jgi:hypothetical protein
MEAQVRGNSKLRVAEQHADLDELILDEHSAIMLAASTAEVAHKRGGDRVH